VEKTLAPERWSETIRKKDFLKRLLNLLERQQKKKKSDLIGTEATKKLDY
jgi:hypothetical protein